MSADEVWTEGTSIAAKNTAALTHFREWDDTPECPPDCRVCWEPIGESWEHKVQRRVRRGWQDGPNAREPTR